MQYHTKDDNKTGDENRTKLSEAGQGRRILDQLLSHIEHDDIPHNWSDWDAGWDRNWKILPEARK